MNQTQLMAARLPDRVDLARLGEAQAIAARLREISSALGDTPQGRTAARLVRLSPAELHRAAEARGIVRDSGAIDYEREARQMQTRQVVRGALDAERHVPTLDLLRSPPGPRRGAPVEPLPGRLRLPASAPPAAPGPSPAPVPTAGQIAARRTHASRTRALAFLTRAGLLGERDHLLAIEERLGTPGLPARHHAALSTRLVLKGVADLCFAPRVDLWRSRSGRTFEVAEVNVGNRLIAFVEGTFSSAEWREETEFRLFVAQVDALARFGGRGPHRIYHHGEGERHLLRLLEVLDLLARAWARNLGALPAI